MSCNIPTLNISVEDCAGDAAGKHNYNALVLDTMICNLSSTIITQDNSIDKVYSELSDLINNFINIFPDYTDEKTYKFLTASTTVHLMSSIWQNNEFSLIYPMNGTDLFPDPSNIIDTPAIQKYVSGTKEVSTPITYTTYGASTNVNLAFDTEYSIADYESAVASCNGSPGNTGTITLVIDGVERARYTASGRNKIAGDDTYVSWDQQFITTWENFRKYKLGSKTGFPGGSKFKFTKSKKGIKYSISAVKRGAATTTTTDRVSHENYQSIEDTQDLAKIQSRGLSYLNQYFSPISFRESTIVNLNILISDITSTPTDPKQLILETYTPETFNRDNRTGAYATNRPLEAVYTRPSIHISKNVILRYQIKNNVWVYLDKKE
jgi:hypothetical protein